MRILFLTTSFPRFDGDYRGVFVFHLARHLRKIGVQIDVIVPDDGRAATNEVLDGIFVHRFHSVCGLWKDLVSTEGGIPEALRRQKALVLITPFLLMSFVLKAMGHARKADLIHCQWLPLGFVGLILHCLTGKPFLITLRGSDKVFLKNKFGWLSEGLLSRSRGVVAVSQELKRQVPQGIPCTVIDRKSVV
jgi:glycosyltransferase involved in cell wall biosynthesis